MSEKCSKEAVACRIRIDNHAVEFYEYSALYDRNQFVCVLKNEYGLVDKSGCVTKRSGLFLGVYGNGDLGMGGVRCWCYGRNDCNSVESSKRLYQAFMSGDDELYQKTIEDIDGSGKAHSKVDDWTTAKPTMFVLPVNRTTTSTRPPTTSTITDTTPATSTSTKSTKTTLSKEVQKDKAFLIFFSR